MLLLSEAEVERLLDVDALLAALEDAFRAYSRGDCSVPARVMARSPLGRLGVMPGHVPGHGLAAKLVSVFAANAAVGLPSHQALIALFDAADGRPLAVMGGTRITALRTAAASALAVRLLARRGARVLAVVGAGVQGSAHLEVVPRVLEGAEVRIASRTPAHAQALARRHPGAAVAASFEEAVRGADVVCCCTDAMEPIIDDAWLAPGALVTSVAAFGHEIAGATIARARLFVEWRGAASQPPPAGAHELEAVDPERVTELGEVLLGARPGRVADDELVLYKSTGLAVEDVAAARLVHDRARALRVGTEVGL